MFWHIRLGRKDDSEIDWDIDRMECLGSMDGYLHILRKDEIIVLFISKTSLNDKNRAINAWLGIGETVAFRMA